MQQSFYKILCIVRFSLNEGLSDYCLTLYRIQERPCVRALLPQDTADLSKLS